MIFVAKARFLRLTAAVAAITVAASVSLRVSADPPASPVVTGVRVSTSAPVHAAPDRHATRGQYLARTALAYRGVPYRWGGRSPRSGFDCSGLVQAVCAKWGILLPRLGGEQYHAGVPVKPADLQPGDLVFFKNTYKRGISHVGIYIGENCFVHAPGRGKYVCISRLDGYHKNHWAGARRLNLSKLPPVSGEQAPTPERVILSDSPDVSTTNPATDSTPGG